MTDLQHLQSQLQALLARRAPEVCVPGVAVGVAHRGERVFAVHGVTSTENPLEVNEQTLFAIGSITKTYTATALMRLVEDGKVALDAPVRTYLPDLALKDPEAAADVTVLQLLNHTAGWDGGDSAPSSGRGDDALARLVESLATYEQVSHPGAVASYNNAALAVAGRVVEVVTGQTYEQAVRELVLQPLGLTDSYFDAHEIITRRFAVGHGSKGQADGSTEVIHYWDADRSMAPAGGLFCSIRDLVSYGAFHLSDGIGIDGIRVLSREALTQMQRASTSHVLDDAEVGISWFLRDLGGTPTVGHTGGTLSGAAVLDLVPEHDLVLAATVNSIGAGSMELFQEVRALVLEAYLGLRPLGREVASLTAEELAQYVGSYDRGGSFLDVTVAGDHLVVDHRHSDEIVALFQQLRPGEELPASPPIHLLPLGQDRFARADRERLEVDATFVRIDGDAVDAVRWSSRVARRAVTSG